MSPKGVGGSAVEFTGCRVLVLMVFAGCDGDSDDGAAGLLVGLGFMDKEELIKNNVALFIVVGYCFLVLLPIVVGL